MEDPKQHVIDSLKQGTNILVTVKSDPSIDQLAACIALTLIMNEVGKHGTAVFSGQVPSVLEFLEPEKTLEKNTDSLQDFIISLDKAKADKLRYKVEDKVVKIFITPYRTSLSGKDLEFGQGDFNVDVVVALGVHEQNDLDEAITAHGRILHDATVISINTSGEANRDLGSINWTDSTVSSLSELVATLADQLGEAAKDKDDDGSRGVIDNQIATALLTGIVAETERFGNAKTKPETMEIAAKLLAAGANQELVAAKLSAPPPPPPMPEPMSIQEMSQEPPREGYNERGFSNPSQSSGFEGSQGNGPTEFEIPRSEDSAGSEKSEGSENQSPDADERGENASENQPPQESQDASFSINSDGELSIDHPREEVAEASEPSVPGPESAEPYRPSSDTPDMPPPILPSGGQIPPVYNPGQPGPSNPPSPPSFPNSPPATEVTGQGEPGEEQAALDYLKEHKVDTAGNTRTIEPLHTKDYFATGGADNEPKLGPAVAEPGDEAVSKVDLTGNKYALTPPSFGGRLTSSTPAATASGGDLPILTHEKSTGPEPTVPTPYDDNVQEAVLESPVKPAVNPEPPTSSGSVPMTSVMAPAPNIAPLPPVISTSTSIPEPIPPVSVLTPVLMPPAPVLVPTPVAPAKVLPLLVPMTPLPPVEQAEKPAPAAEEPEANLPSGESPKLEAAPASDAGAQSVQPAPLEDQEAQLAPATSSGLHSIQATPLDPSSYRTLADLENEVHKAEAAAKNGTPVSASPQPKLEASLDSSLGAASPMHVPPTIKLPSPQTMSATGTSQSLPLAPPPPVPPPFAAV
jgi:hypothetical protein